MDSIMDVAGAAGRYAQATEQVHGPAPVDPELAQLNRSLAQGADELVKTSDQVASAIAPEQIGATRAAGGLTQTATSSNRPAEPIAPDALLSGNGTLPELKGQSEASTWLKQMASRLALRTARGDMKLGTSFRLSAAFCGPDGVGRRLAAQQYAHLLAASNVISDPHVTVIDVRRVLDDGNSLAEAIASAKESGGVILLENVQALNVAKNKAEIKVIADAAKADQEPIVLLSGSPQLRSIIDTSWKLKDIFSNQVNFKPLAAEDLRDIAVNEATRRGYTLDQSAITAAFGRLRSVGRSGAKTAIALIDKAELRMSERLFPEGKLPAAPYGETELKTMTAHDLEGDSPFNPDGTLKALEDFKKKRVGQAMAKQFMDKIVKVIQTGLRRQAEGKKVTELNLNMTIDGEPGTGKTTIIEFINDIYTQLGVRNGKIVYKTAAEVMGQARGEAEAIARQLFDEAQGGMIVIDEFHQLFDTEFGKAFLKAAMPLSLNNFATTSFVGLGYNMKGLYKTDPGWDRRIPGMNRLSLESFSRDQLADILKQNITEEEYQYAAAAIDAALLQLDIKAASPNFGNAGEAKNQVQKAILNAAFRGAADDVLLPEDFGTPPRSASEIADTVNDYIGLETMRPALTQIGEQVEDNRVRKVPLRSNIPTYGEIAGNDEEQRRSAVSALATAMRDLGILGNAVPQYVDALGMKAGFLGQTADKVHERTGDALGGIMVLTNLRAFVDSYDKYGTEAVGALIEDLKNNKDKLAFMLSGSEEDIRDFVALDPTGALAELVTEKVSLDPLTQSECTELFRRTLEKQGYKLDAEAEMQIDKQIAKAYEAPGFSGTATVNTLVNRVKTEHTTVRNRAEYLGRDRFSVAPEAVADAIEKFVNERVLAAENAAARELVKGMPIANPGRVKPMPRPAGRDDN
jgi:hypothetical protein